MVFGLDADSLSDIFSVLQKIQVSEMLTIWV